MNNKGFAITTILYGVLILFLMLLLSMLGILSTYSDRLEMLIEKNNGARYNINYENIGYWGSEVEKNTDKTAYKMTYNISDDDVITITANRIDGWGFLPYYVELEADKTYYFSCNTDGEWGTEGNTVEAYLMLNGVYNDVSTIHFKKGSSEFKAKESGKYYLRLDVNENGMTRTFSNIKVMEKKIY